MSLLSAFIFKNSRTLAGFYFIFLKKRPRLNLTDFQFQIWTSVKKSSKTNFSASLQISCSNFRLKLCQRSYSYENCQTNQFGRGLKWARSNKLYSETIIYKILRQTLAFMWNRALREKFNFCFLGDFYYYWQNIWRRTEH